LPSDRAFAFAFAHSWSLTLIERIFFIICLSYTETKERKTSQLPKTKTAPLPSNLQYGFQKERLTFSFVLSLMTRAIAGLIGTNLVFIE
jgi:ABC-type multidrug transport system fused ATPase/permease subunit